MTAVSEGAYILALDQGTTSSRAIVFDHAGHIVSSHNNLFTQIFPQPGWVEHDPREIWSSQVGALSQAVAQAGVRPDQIAAIGITNQRETTIVWDRHTGEPVANAIVWQCRRTADAVAELVERGYADLIHTKTGLVPDAYFSASKIAWILDNVEGARERAERGDLLFGTVDTWLIWNLTGGAAHVTDYTNASRTMLFNIHTLSWDDELLELFDIPRCMLPEVRPSRSLFGNAATGVLAAPIPICGVAGDQQAALFGQCCFEAGEAKNTYGTGCFLLMNTGSKPVLSEGGLVTTCAASADGSPAYALEGSVFVGGALVQWIRDELSFVETAAQTDEVASSVPDTGGVYIVPAFTGLGAPYWDPHARGTIVGLTRGTGRAHLVRAALEALAYQSMDVIDAMSADAGLDLVALKVDGGASANDFLMQFQADILGCPVSRPSVIETTALGAAYLAGLEVGYWSGIDDLRANWEEERRFLPSMDENRRHELVRGWHDAVDRSLTR